MTKPLSIFLGIDPGTGRTGWGVIKKNDAGGTNPTIEYVAHGCIVTEKEDTMPERLLVLHKELEGIIYQYKPHCLIVEQLFFGRNIRTAMSVGQARGVVMLSAANNSLPLLEYTSISVKHYLSGSGKTEKKDLQVIVRRLLSQTKRKLSFNTKDKGFDDSADALAIAIHHALKLDGHIFNHPEPKKKINKKKIKKISKEKPRKK
ncbi:MAG: crossover junction endodeoxyribonuclease RuvC [Candidatus Levybacteria bacterium CG_4_10_14_0_2_um_filter_36_16]|nr:MAG: crossover junction endodeoxyribonuclease RuvC [Candidatus Levybacteria bacterium CG2_30_37_29]PIR78778.1 MAG: crossover junction endodeoxyribonuclease RuvC [Candidatus Levybacteria bacterium CG10_big_fil_rev_8_21_14_0_10_36_30]PIZ96494.1 MAG: crossover junction endodeoxyribonuclease RuvC [Candidatus Levybacteria bacterium CG_4_10_14_0_2_um_filter_36_16]PJA90784.1 MAG: crossover junction endodeoxyribonuclease RuvC [Candidatus Levybacteria bacterium CG_4_9_14_3_um_filter_36_7]